MTFPACMKAMAANTTDKTITVLSSLERKGGLGFGSLLMEGEVAAVFGGYNERFLNWQNTAE